jgi:alpha-glucosidase
MPVMQPVFFADPKDSTLRKEEQAFLVGTDLLVIPKWAVNPALPTGIWRTASIAGENSATDRYQADVKIKGGAIIPLGKIIQNTTQYNLQQVTLLVSLDKNGKASGTLYEDSGDGFQYKKGEYLISGFTAKQVGSTVKVEITAREGNLKAVNRKYKVIVITNNGTVEGSWTKSTSISVKL